MASCGRPFTPASGFDAIVKAIDPGAPFEWIKSSELERIEKTGVLYLTDISVATHARRRARELFDWPIVYRQYQPLRAELNARRASAAPDPIWQARLAAAPKSLSSSLDPYSAVCSRRWGL